MFFEAFFDFWPVEEGSPGDAIAYTSTFSKNTIEEGKKGIKKAGRSNFLTHEIWELDKTGFYFFIF